MNALAVGLCRSWPVGVVSLLLALSCRAATRAAPGARVAPGDDTEFLLQLQRDAFDLGWYETSPRGLTLDRVSNLAPQGSDVASVAATGFMLATLPVGVSRGYISRQQAEERAILTLQALLHDVQQTHGFLRHFVDPQSGANRWSSEFSTVDTTIALAGAIVASEYLDGDVRRLTDEFYNRVDWLAAMTRDGLLIHGWREPDQPLACTWDVYSEGILCYLLGSGAPQCPLPESSWLAWDRVIAEYRGRAALLGGLYVITYPAAFVCFRDRLDVRAGSLDYDLLFRNTVWVNQQFCIDQGAQDGSYGEAWWGLSATDGPDGGYHAYQPLPPNHDGTINIPALLSAVAIDPDRVIPTVRALYQEAAPSYGRYGFCSANNRRGPYASGQVVAIDSLAAVLGIENHLSGLIWDLFHRSEAVRRGLRRVGLRSER